MTAAIEQFTTGDEYICRGIVLVWERSEDGEFRREATYVSTVKTAEEKIQQAASDGWTLIMKVYGDLWYPTLEGKKVLEREEPRQEKTRSISSKAPTRSLRVYRPSPGGRRRGMGR